MRRSRLLAIAPACAALAIGCAAPRALYDGPALPPEKVVRLRGFRSTNYGPLLAAKGRPVAGSGEVVLIGLDGKIFNDRIYAAYSGSDFLLVPGRHILIAYCEYTRHGADSQRVFYSDLFTLAFTAHEGRSYRYKAAFDLGTTANQLSLRHPGLTADPGVWDVTENRSSDSSNRVNEEEAVVPLTFRSLAHIQAAVGGRRTP